MVKPDNGNRWDGIATWFAVAVLVTFTVVSCKVNAMYADTIHTSVWFHASVPVAVLIASLLLELTMLSSAHGWARWVVLSGTCVLFGVTLVASYLAVLEMVNIWNPAAPPVVNEALAATPDAFMVLSATLLLSLRFKAHAAVETAPNRTVSSWRRITAAVGDGLAARAERAAALPESSQVDALVEAPPTSVETSVDASMDAVEPSMKPFMDAVVEDDSASMDAAVEPVVSSAETSTSASVEESTASTETSAEAVATPTKTSVETPAKPRKTSTKPSTNPVAEVIDPAVEVHLEAARWMVETEVVARKSEIEIAKVIREIVSKKSPNRIKSELGISPATTAKIADALHRWDELAEDQPRELLAV